MTGNMRLPEILAPAGSMESVYAAVRCGADGVYVGGRDFSARASAENFSEEELFAAARYCHLHGVKIYRAMNTVIFDRERESFFRQVQMTARAGFDGLIIQDMGGLRLAKAAAPGMPLHASTQMTVHTPLGAREAVRLGFCRVVPARELTLGQIADICRTMGEEKSQTEVFVHGAQCMCLSGQCYMSSVIGSRSANRGRCAQSCRLPVSGVGKGKFSQAGSQRERYDLSLKDMSLVAHTSELAAAGVNSFKIEGRMKRPEYVAAAVTALRHALYGGGDGGEDMRRLEAVFSRSGFTDGYLTGRLGREMFGSRTKEDVTAAESVLGGLAALYNDEIKDGVMDFTLTVREGEAVRLDFCCTNRRGERVSGSVYGDIPEKARNREFTAADGKRYLSKLGGTRYDRGKISCDIAQGLALSAACINDLRRRACETADRLTVQNNTPVYEITEEIPLHLTGNVRVKREKIPERVSFRIIADSFKVALPAADRAEYIILPVGECEREAVSGEIARKIIVRLPDIVTDEGALLTRLKRLTERGFTRFFCNNFTHTGVLGELGNVHIHGGWGMNITNSDSLLAAAEMGFEDACLSFEMKAGQIRAVQPHIPAGIYAYGRLPLMTVRNCPVKAANGGCKGCGHSLTDRSGRIFPVRCGEGYAQVLNCDILQVCGKLEDFSGISFVLLDLAGEDVNTARKALESCISGETPSGRFTGGLYYRGTI